MGIVFLLLLLAQFAPEERMIIAAFCILQAWLLSTMSTTSKPPNVA